jgi:DNA-binding beta-propeller fold protein YncE
MEEDSKSIMNSIPGHTKALLRALLCLLALSLSLSLAPQTASGASQAGKADAAREANAPEGSAIEVGDWVKPKSGWLYVLDPKPDAGGSAGRIWLLDPETAKVMGSIGTDNHADFALSPDGSRLYIASDAADGLSDFAVIDTAQGTVLQRGTIENRAVTQGMQPFSAMSVSSDGLAWRILIENAVSEDKETFLLATFDTQTGKFLPGDVHLGNCGYGRFISHPTVDQFDFLCPRTNRVRLIRVDAESRARENRDVVLPWERRVGVAEALVEPGGNDLAIVRGDAAIFTMDAATQEFAGTPVRPDLPARIYPAAWPTSPDGGTVYVGYTVGYDHYSDNRFYLHYGRAPNVRPDTAMAREFRVFDTGNWRKLGKIKTSMPFWSAITGNDGKILYALAPKKHSILVIDTVKMRQVRTITVGGMPSLALVMP